jgi:hypothetical protein
MERHSGLVESFLSKAAGSGAGTRGAEYLDIWCACWISYAVMCCVSYMERKVAEFWKNELCFLNGETASVV